MQLGLHNIDMLTMTVSRVSRKTGHQVKSIHRIWQRVGQVTVRVKISVLLSRASTSLSVQAQQSSSPGSFALFGDMRNWQPCPSSVSDPSCDVLNLTPTDSVFEKTGQFGPALLSAFFCDQMDVQGATCLSNGGDSSIDSSLVPLSVLVFLLAPRL